MIDGALAAEVALSELVVGVVREAEEADRRDARICCQKRRHRARVGLVARQAHGQGLEALKEQERVERRQGGARVAQTDRPAAGDVRGVREVDRVSNAVKRRLGLDHDAEPVGVIGPRERAAVDDDPAERRAVAADELRQRVDHDVGPVAGTA